MNILTIMEKIEHTKFVIQRFDSYFESINTKSTFYLSYNLFALGGLAAAYIPMATYVNLGIHTKIIYVIALVLGAVSMILTYLAINPFLKNNNNSLLFFGSISEKSNCQYGQEVNNLDEPTLLKDYICQSKILAEGINYKYKKLTYAGYFMLVQFITICFLFILLFNNLKTY